MVRRLTGAIGAEVRGIDLSRPLDPGGARAVLDAFHEHVVLVFRGQSLEPRAQLEFTRLIGEPQAHPLRTRRSVEGHEAVLVLENRPGRRGARNDYWHSDISHAECPPAASVLHALEVPDGRGDTLFCNMYAAYEGLSAGLRATLADLRAVHSGEATLRRASEESTDALPITEVPPSRAHPVVRTHPHSGRRALFVNPHFTVQLEDMTGEESAQLLEHLYARATVAENVYRHRWQRGDVLVWDNRAAMHYAVRDYDESMHRLLHRTTAAGERPR